MCLLLLAWTRRARTGSGRPHDGGLTFGWMGLLQPPPKRYGPSIGGPLREAGLDASFYPTMPRLATQFPSPHMFFSQMAITTCLIVRYICDIMQDDLVEGAVPSTSHATELLDAAGRLKRRP